MFDALKKLVEKRKAAMNPDDEPVKRVKEGDGYDEVEQKRIRRAEDTGGETTRRNMNKVFKKGGSIMKKNRFADGGEIPAEYLGSVSGGLPPISRDKREAEEDTGAVTGRLHKGRPKTKSGGFTIDKRGFKKGGSVGSASRRADGVVQRGKTKGRMV